MDINYSRFQFLSEEDLDLVNLSDDELSVYWDLWLLQAQQTNDLDRFSYSHGVFMLMNESNFGGEIRPPPKRS